MSVPQQSDATSGSIDDVEFDGQADAEPIPLLFPVGASEEMRYNLEKPRWNIYFAPFTSCVAGVGKVYRSANRTAADEVALWRFHRAALQNAMHKCYVESHHKSWTQEIQSDLFEHAIAYSTMCVHALQLLIEQPDYEWSTPPQAQLSLKLRDLVAEQLHMLSWVIDAEGAFGQSFACMPVPLKLSGRFGDLMSETDDDAPGWAELALAKFESLEGWRLLCQAITEVDFTAEAVEKMLAPLAVSRMHLARTICVPDHQGRAYVSSAVLHIVKAANDCLAADDLAALTIRGEPTFRLFCDLSRHLRAVAEVCMDADEVEATALALHRSFLEKMLARRSFSAMLTLVREVVPLLGAAPAPAAPRAGGAPAASGQRTLAWLREHKVVEQLLTVGMHQKQYVDSVKMLLEALAKRSALEKPVLEELWHKLRQEGVMDVVRGNVSELLQRVVRLAHVGVLSDLVASLSLAEIKSAADAHILAMLFEGLYDNTHTDEALARRCLDFLWSLAMSPAQRRFVVPGCGGGSGGCGGGDAKNGMSDSGSSDDGTPVHVLAQSIMTAEHCFDELWENTRDRVKHSFALMYMRKCQQLLERQEALCVALPVLQCLLHRFTQRWRGEAADAPLEQRLLALHQQDGRDDMLALTAASLCAWTPAAAKAPLADDFGPLFLQFLQLVAIVAREQQRWRAAGGTTRTVPPELVQVLWKHTVALLPADQGIDREIAAAYKLFADLCRLDLMAPEALEPLVAPDAPHQPPQSMTQVALLHYFDIVVAVNLALGLIKPYAPPNLPAGADAPTPQYEVTNSGRVLVGLHYLYEVLVKALRPEVSQCAAQLLVRMFVQPYCAYGLSYASWQPFANEMVRKLEEYARLVAGRAGDGVSAQATAHGAEALDWQQLARDGVAVADDKLAQVHGEKAERVLRLLSLLVCQAHGFNMPLLRPHHACVRGETVQFCIVPSLTVPEEYWPRSTAFVATPRAVPPAVDVIGHGDLYVGDVRDFVARAMRVRAGEIRIMVLGGDADNDAERLSELARRAQPHAPQPLPAAQSALDTNLAMHVCKIRADPTKLTTMQEDTRAKVFDSAPNVTLGGNVQLLHMLLYLLDQPACNRDVHREAYHLLAHLHTFSGVTDDLLAAMAPPGSKAAPSEALRAVLCMPPAGSSVVAQKRPGALLYALEALLAIVRPADKPLASGAEKVLLGDVDAAIAAVLDAVAANYDPALKPAAFWTHFRSIVARVIDTLVSDAAAPAEATVTPAENVSAVAAVPAAIASASGEEAPQGALAAAPGRRKADYVHAGARGSCAGTASAQPMDAENVPQAHDRSPTHGEGAAPPPVAGLPRLAGVVSSDTFLALADFWLGVATNVAAALTPDGHADGARRASGAGGLCDVWPVGGRTHATDHALLAQCVNAHMRQVLAEARGDMLQRILQRPAFAGMVREMLLHRRTDVRTLALVILREFARDNGIAVQVPLLQILQRLLPHAADEDSCHHFFCLFSDVLRDASPSLAGDTRASLMQLFLTELPHLARAAAPAANGARAPPDALDLQPRLSGRLKLLAALWTVAAEHAAAAPEAARAALSSQEHLCCLLDHHLFPEADACSQLRRDAAYVDTLSIDNLQRALAPCCTARVARSAAYELLFPMVKHSRLLMATCLRKLLAMLGAGPSMPDVLPQQFALHIDHAVTVNPRWRGLHTTGATCYMNAVLQQLFCQPTIRALVLRSAQVPQELLAQEKAAVFAAVQLTFANLALSTARAFRPTPLWESLRDETGQPINIHEHEDAHEFLQKLQDCVDSYGPPAPEGSKPMGAAMYGTFVQTITCRTVDYQSRKVDGFYQIMVEVANMGTLQRALDAYFQAELMEGDNAYHYEELGKHVPAIKRTLIERLPHTFVITLKRFEFNYMDLSRHKISERFEFPTKLNMLPYTLAGLPAAARGGAAGAAALPDGYFDYELKGVVVHTGNAFAGHYYSFVKERGAAAAGAGGSGWQCFDDTCVSAWDPANMDECCFGGPATANGSLRPNTAYMLVYERRDRFEPIATEAELQAGAGAAASSAPPAAAPADAAMAQEGPRRETASHPIDDARSSGQGSSPAGSGALPVRAPPGAQRASPPFAPAPVEPAHPTGAAVPSTWPPADSAAGGSGGVPYGMPQALYTHIMQENLWLAQARHLTLPHHTAFLRKLLSECLGVPAAVDGGDLRSALLTARATAPGRAQDAPAAHAESALKRFAVAVDGVPSPVDRAPAEGDAQSPEALATILALKHTLATLVFVPVDDGALHFFVAAAEAGLGKDLAVEQSLSVLLNALRWHADDAPGALNAFLHADSRVRETACSVVVKALSCACAAYESAPRAREAANDAASDLRFTQAMEIMTTLWTRFAGMFVAGHAVADAIVSLASEFTQSACLRNLCDLVASPRHPLVLLLDAVRFTCAPNTRVTPRAARCVWAALSAMAFVPQERGLAGLRPALCAALDLTQVHPDEAAKLPAPASAAAAAAAAPRDACLMHALSASQRAALRLEVQKTATDMATLRMCFRYALSSKQAEPRAWMAPLVACARAEASAWVREAMARRAVELQFEFARCAPDGAEEAYEAVALYTQHAVLELDDAAVVEASFVPIPSAEGAVLGGWDLFDRMLRQADKLPTGRVEHFARYLYTALATAMSMSAPALRSVACAGVRDQGKAAARADLIKLLYATLHTTMGDNRKRRLSEVCTAAFDLVQQRAAAAPPAADGAAGSGDDSPDGAGTDA